MTKGRLEAFSDGVIAILITIMVLELKTPHGTDISALTAMRPVLLSYLMSFVYLGIYWNNHHHLIQAARHVDGRVLWANLHLLFWLSLVPFATAWIGESGSAPWPAVVYGVVLLCSAISYYILTLVLVALHGKDSNLAIALGKDYKGKISIVIYAVALPLAFVSPIIAYAGYIIVAIMWLVPDQRIEKKLGRSAGSVE
ncbi:MAG: TMEM175 family protein [Verrucomicrobia bacterium]|nr:TMEM175 family protein [Verrucomicrobiota bacterium]